MHVLCANLKYVIKLRRGYLTHIEYRIKYGKDAQILQWVRNGDKRDLTIIEDFEPYFLVEENAIVPQDKRIIREETCDFKSLDGRQLKRIITRLPSDVREAREFFEETWEADVPFADRYRIDNDLIPLTNNQRIFFLDIETMDVNPKSGLPIISIAAYDNILKKYYAFSWKEGISKPVKMDWEDGTRIFLFGSEFDMLQKFIELLNYCNPDIITGWYSNGFDLPYIYQRLEDTELLYPGMLSPIGQTQMRGDEVRIKGRVCFDMLDAYKRIHENELDSWKLDEVANIELGIGKIGTGADAPVMWTEGLLNELLEYNKKDVELLVQLDEKLKIFDFFFALSNKTNAGLENAFYNSKLVDMYLLSLCHRQNIALPTKQQRDTEESIKGATVLKPEAGLKENLAVFDVKSLYPSIIITWNMSPETTNGFMDFNQEPKGLLPNALKDLFEERARLKAEGRNDQQRVVKEIMNSFYGVMLFKNFRLNNRFIGESITHMGREILAWTKDVVEHLTQSDYKVVYGDTDSIFVEGVKTKTEGEEIANIINESYDDLAKKYNLKDHHLTIEFESFVKAALFTGKKKRYALLLEDDTLKIRGFERRRSNSPRLTRDFQEEIFKQILNGRGQTAIKTYIKDEKEKIKDGGVKLLDEIGIPITLQKSIGLYKNFPQHVKAADYSNKYLGTHHGAGSKLLLIFVKKTPFKYPKTEVIALEFGMELPEGFIVNIDEHIKRCIDNPVTPLFEACGWSLQAETKSLFEF